MTQTPFFSVVIPTRNRPELFKDTLQSALSQDFDDFEVIVSDNSTDDNTQAAIEPFLNNPRLTAFRTDGSLSMPEHWEFATTQARGRYVLVLTDRSVFKRHALSAIYAAISSSPETVSVCSWRWSVLDDISRLEYADVPMYGGGTVTLTSQEVAQKFVNRQNVYPYELPRGLNSCYRDDLAAQIRKKYGALFVPLSPDYTCAFLLLAHTEKVLFIDTALFISQGTSVSNGGNAYSSISATESYLKTLGVNDYCAHVPIKMPLVENILFEDFLAIQEMAGRELSTVAMNWVEYFVRCHKEILEKRRVGIMSHRELDAVQKAWNQALKGAAKDIRREVKAQLQQPFIKYYIRQKKAEFARYLHNCGFRPFYWFRTIKSYIFTKRKP